MVEYDARSWVSILSKVRGSVLRRTALPVVLVGSLGGIAAWLHHEHAFHVPPMAHTLLGVVLGLLLVFRTNSSYDRFWEGRKQLGMMVNRARDLARQVTSYVEGSDPAALRDRAELQRLIVVLYALIRQYLRKERDLGRIAELTPPERAALEPIEVRPCLGFTWISLKLAACARAGRLTEQRLQLMDGNLTSFSDSWGGAERIMKSPIPFAYAHHIKAFLIVFAFSAPFALVETMRWMTPVASAIMAFALFGIDEIGIEIEDPFGYDANDLPLDPIGDTIARDTAEIVALANKSAAPSSATG
jgi:putative membrane protein